MSDARVALIPVGEDAAAQRAAALLILNDTQPGDTFEVLMFMPLLWCNRCNRLLTVGVRVVVNHSEKKHESLWHARLVDCV